MTRARRLLAIAAISVLLAGCSPAEEEETLVLEGAGLSACLPGEDSTTGFIAVPMSNTGESPIVLSGIAVGSVMGSQLSSSWVLPTGDDVPGSDGSAADPLSTGVTYFGPEAPGDSAAWAARDRALGATIPAGTDVTLALEVVRPPDAPTAAVDGATVSYTGSGGGSLLATSGFYFQFATLNGACALPE